MTDATRKTSNSSVALTVTLLGLMFIIGIMTGTTGYIFGRNALKGITQPAFSPIVNEGGDRSKLPKQGTSFFKERDILAKVEAKTSGVRKSDKPAVTPEPAKEKSSNPKKAPAQAKGLPITSEAQGVTFEVRNVTQESDDVVLDVALKNKGKKSVQFLYNFMEVSDGQGRTLTAVTKGLPTEIQPGGETFSGTVKISRYDLADAKQVSLSMVDYPDQTVRLEVANVPVR